MATLVIDPALEARLKAQRKAVGADRYDEVWEGIYMMAPMPNPEHQQMVSRLVSILEEVVGWPGRGEVFPGVNLSDRFEDWEHEYRVPDITVFLRGGKAQRHAAHWRGPADLLTEITSPGDRTREKLPFYRRLGVVELLIVDRESWTLELYRQAQQPLELVGRSTLSGSETLASTSVPLTFRLVPAAERPQIETIHPPSGRRWLV